ncbi:GGDEF domain-containing protein [Segnochrobactraceae bacterium EtOH-i3]
MAEPGALLSEFGASDDETGDFRTASGGADASTRALAFLSRHGLAATPVAYAVAHAYVTGEPAALVLAIDAFERAGRRLDALDVERFADLFLGGAGNERADDPGLDPLTELPDRAAFEAMLSASVREARHQGHALSLLVVGIERIEKIEARHGRALGEEVLRALGRAFETAMQGLGRVARYGDHAFAILLPRTNLRQTVAVGEHIRRLVARRAVMDRETGETLGRLTLSAGAVTLRKDDGARDLKTRGEACLEEARGASGNRVVAETDAEEILLPRRIA